MSSGNVSEEEEEGEGGEAGEHRSCKIAPFRRTHCCEARRPPTGRDHFYFQLPNSRHERYTPVARQRNPRDHTPPFPGSQSREVRDEGRGLSKERGRATARQRSSEAEGLLFFGKYSVYNTHTHTHTWRGRGAPAGAKAAASESLHLLLRSLRTHLRRPRPSPRPLSSPRPRQARCRPSRRCRPSSPPSG